MSLRQALSIVIGACLACGVHYSVAQTSSGLSRLHKVVTVAKFNPTQSQLPEGVALDNKGNVYVGFYPTGQIFKIAADGKRSLFATLNVGPNPAAGLVGFTFDPDGDLYVCLASFRKETHGIWRVSPDGSINLVARLDPTGFPNDLVFHDGYYYITDSYLGEIWKVSKSGAAEVWIKSPLLNPATPTCCYGANGLQFDRGYLYVANTDLGTIVRIKPGLNDGKPTAEVYVKSPALIGADGLSIDVEHNIYITADYLNTLVKVTATGDIETLATREEGLDFPADTYFGQSPGKRPILYWTNGGYNFGKPSLQKMDVGIKGARLP
jgi:hypothetical protein